MLMSKVALLVGVSEYQPGLPPLPSVIEDVGAMERVLHHPKIGGFDEVKVLRDPNTQDLRLAIYNLFAERSPEDLVLFYFSGHGVKDQNRNLFLATPETIKSQKGLVVTPTAVAASYLQTQINDSRSEHEVIILDCCYSGAIAKGLTAKDEGEVDIIAELGGKGRAILTSSTAVQSSFQQEGALSIYTQYLVEGMETGAADFDNDGRISTDELHQYASNKVQQASPAMTPQFYPVEEGYKIFLARSLQDDPNLRYRKAVQEIFKENQGEIDQLLDRPYLDELSQNLGISLEETKNIENEVLQPFRQLQQKLQRYEDVFSQALQKDSLITDKVRLKLKRLQEILELRDQDIAPIEAQLIPKIELKTETKPKFTESVPKSENKSQLPPKQIDNQSLQVFEFDIVTVEVQPGFLGLGSKVELNRSCSQAQYFTEDLGNGFTLDMVSIPEGSFLMGTEDEEIERLVKKISWDGFRREKPQHKVTVQPFFMGKFQVTQAQYQEVMGKNPSNFKGDERPVEQVSGEDAVEFCQRLSKQTGNEYRLPSEAEWEYACRAGTTTPFHFGETITTDLANYRGTDWEYNGKVYPGNYANEPKGKYRQKTTLVGNFTPNTFGLYDMHGNVWEWCQDDWHGNYEQAPTDGSPWFLEKSSKKVIYDSLWNDNPSYCRSAYRSNVTRDDRDSNIGFRVVRVAPGAT